MFYNTISCHSAIFSVFYNKQSLRNMDNIKVIIQDPVLKEFLLKRFPLTVLPQEQFMEADYYIGDTCTDHIEFYKGVTVLYTAENHPVDLNRFDYCITHEYGSGDRFYRYPYWLNQLMIAPELRDYMLGNRPKVTPEELVKNQTEFCSFVCRNEKGKERNALVRALMKKRKVNCAGPFMNNTGSILPKGQKHEYQRKHAFSMAYENESYPGYQTEKIVDAFVSGSIPIYWGNPLVEREFNPAAFVNAHNFRNLDELVKYILELADDPVRRAEMINADLLRDPEVFEKTDRELEELFARIFERGPGAIRRTRGQQFMAVAQKFYGHGLFRTLRFISRRIRGKR